MKGRIYWEAVFSAIPTHILTHDGKFSGGAGKAYGANNMTDPLISEQRWPKTQYLSGPADPQTE